MTTNDFAYLRTPVSETDACGPDLDLAGDADYMNLMARVEGVLPASYFSFDRSKVDLAAEIEALKRLSHRTRDLRVLTLLTKLLAFDKKLSAFNDCMTAIVWLLDEHWNDVHPCVESDDLDLRGAILQTLDDMPHVVLPVQYLPLIESRRSGRLTYRSVMIANGEVKRREDESALDLSTINQALVDCDLPALIETRDEIVRLKASIAGIRSVWIKHAGFDNAPNLDRLEPLADKILAFIDGGVARRDPGAALGAIDSAAAPADGSAPSAPGASDTAKIATQPVRTTREAAAGFAAVVAYFMRQEPSNPSLLLIRQAQRLVGKNVVEILRILVPETFDEVRIHIGTEPRVSFPMERLSQLMQDTDDASETDGPSESDRVIEVGTRAQAVDELEHIAAFYRGTEPSSPIPILIDRARTLVPLDFMSLLREITPKRD